MHEIGLVDDIICVINAKLKTSGENSRLKKINIAIGELEHISPGHFEFHFRERAKDTPFASVELDFKKVKVKFRCKNCQAEFLYGISKFHTTGGARGVAGNPSRGNSEVMRRKGALRNAIGAQAPLDKFREAKRRGNLFCAGDLECPVCNSKVADIISGSGIYVDSIELA